MNQSNLFWVYLIRCGDNSLYCGVAVNVQARIRQHAAGSGAKYTRGRGPFELVVSAGPMSRGDALRLEATVKRRKKAEKVAYLAANSDGEEMSVDLNFHYPTR